ncbi:MAG: helix-turn-helix domain-containing protein [Pseudonocardiaceae bacterium]
MYTVLTTEDLPASDRFAFWLEILSHAIVPFTLRSDHQADFRAQVHAADLGAVSVTRLIQPSTEGQRTAKLIRQSDPEFYQFGVNVRGHVQISRDQHSVTLAPGDLVLLDSSRPFHWVGDGAGEVCVGLTLAFPRALLSLPENKVSQLLLVRMPGREGIGRLLSRYLVDLTVPDDEWRPADAVRLATIALDLLTAMLAHQLEADELMPAENRQRVLLVRIHSFIQQHLDDPDLSPGMIAAAHGISVRSLHRLFRDSDNTVTRWIQACRLDRCRRDLLDPRSNALPVHAIAARWGIPDAAHFNRAFRRAYGISPQAYRHECGEPAPSGN